MGDSFYIDSETLNFELVSETLNFELLTYHEAFSIYKIVLDFFDDIGGIF